MHIVNIRRPVYFAFMQKIRAAILFFQKCRIFRLTAVFSVYLGDKQELSN